MTTAYLFPGQGSQAVGMGRDLAEAFPIARETFQEVDEALKQNLSKIMFEGPEEELTKTVNTQPAIMAASMAVVRVLEKEMGLDIGKAQFVAGHSLGEYAALTAAKALPLAETARLLRIRGDAMQEAVPEGKGLMAAIIGLTLEDVVALCAEAHQGGEICEAANHNSPEQIVISGTRGGVEKGMELAKAKGAKRALPLVVSAPFHCSLMQPAADAMAEALKEAPINAPIVPVVANVTASAEQDADTIRRLLVEQVTGMVKWRSSINYMKEQGVTRMVELGHGKVLSGLVKRTEPDVEMLNVGSPADFDSFAKAA